MFLQKHKLLPPEGGTLHRVTDLDTWQGLISKQFSSQPAESCLCPVLMARLSVRHCNRARGARNETDLA
jgi:hypothetical protein